MEEEVISSMKSANSPLSKVTGLAKRCQQRLCCGDQNGSKTLQSRLAEFIILVNLHITALTSVCLYQSLLKFRGMTVYRVVSEQNGSKRSDRTGTELTSSFHNPSLLRSIGNIPGYTHTWYSTRI